MSWHRLRWQGMRTFLDFDRHPFLHGDKASLPIADAINPDETFEAHAHHAIGSSRYA
jgi:hypothetical protein